MRVEEDDGLVIGELLVEKKIDGNFFDFERFWSMNFWAIGSYKSLIEYVTDKESVEEYVNRNTYTHINGEIGVVKIGASKEMVEAVNDDLLSAKLLMNNQMIVYLVSVLEVALNDFFKCIFVDKPELVLELGKYLGESDAELGVSYKDFLQFESKEAYIAEIAKRAASKCNSGKFDKVLNRLSKIFDVELPAECKNALKDLYEKRNKIVHENYRMDISEIELENFSNKVEKCIKILALKLKNRGIRVRDTGLLLEQG